MNITFHASAGTGKTYQVTSLYVALVLGRPYDTTTADGKTVRLHNAADGAIEPGRILLMTFTDNAAAELRTRVTELVLRARHEADEANDAETLARTITVLRALPSASICTIHSFCAGFLRERALDAGLAPGFAVLDQTDAEDLLDQVARDELLARLRKEADSYDPAFQDFCTGERVIGGEYGGSVIDAAKALLRQASSRGLDLRDAEQMLPKPDHTVTPRDFQQLFEEFKKAKAARAGELPAQAAAVFQVLDRHVRSFSAAGKPSDLEDRMEALATEIKPSFRGTGLAELSTKLKQLVERVNEVALYRRHYDPIRAFVRFAAAVAKAYAERKYQLGALDFDDLLVRARDVLAGAGDTSHSLFDYVIVDEVQDTSRVQCEIIRSLWRPPKNRLAICGDTKQSIYAWRNADPAVMPDLESDIAATKRFQKVALRASFRSKDSILDLVNALFARVYGEAYGEHEKLVAAKEKNGFVRKAGEGPCVEFLRAAWEQEPSPVVAEIPDNEERVRLEMTALAQRIKLLVEGPAEWRTKFRYSGDTERFEEAGKKNRFRYADILILLRRTTNQQVLEQLLRQYQIPYRIGGGRGRGLFARPEVVDSLLFLKVLTHSFDTISLIGFLRSPWVGLSDESILQLGWDGPGFDEPLFRRRVMSPDGENVLASLFGTEQADRLGKARRLIVQYRALADCTLASDMIRELIRDTGYDAVIAGTFRGGQRLANLRKLIDWLQATERGGTVLLADVVRLLEEYADSPPDVPEATLMDPDQNVVTIMTVHGAKGLTARVVLIPELAAKPSGESPWALLSTHTGKPQLYVKTEDLERTEASTPGFKDARDAAAEIRKAEAKNVYYVALTRARDLVVLSGAAGSQKADPWRAELDQLLAESEEVRTLVRAIPYADLAEAAHRNNMMPQRLEPVSNAATGLTERLAQATEAFTSRVSIKEIVRFPATMLSAFHSDPEEFLRTALPGSEPFWMKRHRLPEQAEMSGDDVTPAADSEAPASYAAFGTAGHAVLEELARGGWRDDMARLVNTAADEAGLPGQDRKDLELRIAKVVREIAPLVANAAAPRAEWPFSLYLRDATSGVIVDGTIDLFCKGKDGELHIFDYKFTDDPPARLLRRYGLQLNLYRLALRRCAGVPQLPVAASLVAVGRDHVHMVDVPEEPMTEQVAITAAQELARVIQDRG